jgi:predicted RNA binding protein YcfA (HicA-like mRNA interferase family)
VKVREAIKLIEQDGWQLVRTRGAPRQFEHPGKPGLVAVPGNLGDELAPGTLNGGVERMKYLIVIEPVGVRLTVDSHS